MTVDTVRIDCPCDSPDCPRFGAPRAKRWRDGSVHVRRCPCRRCEGSRHHGRARIRENRVAKATGGTREPGSGAVSGVDTRGVCLTEETSNESIVRGVRRWLHSKAVSQKFSRLMAQAPMLPRVRVLSWDGKPQVAVIDFADFEQLCALRESGDGELQRIAARLDLEVAQLRGRLG